MNRRIIFLISVVVLALGVRGQETTPEPWPMHPLDVFTLTQWDKPGATSPVPEVHGTLRPRYEYCTAQGVGRFEVKNGAVNVNGHVFPWMHYFIQADFCAEGRFVMLDAEALMDVARGLKLVAGQMRIPFTVDATRPPHIQYFANRSFIGKYVANYRSVGVKAGWQYSRRGYVEAGVYNGAGGMGNHNVWQTEKGYAYGIKTSYRIGCVTPTLAFQSLKPEDVRFNSLNAALEWTPGRWHLEGEYVMKHYMHDAFRDCHTWDVFADYWMPVQWGYFNRLSFQARYDGMTDHSNGVKVGGKLIANQTRRQRATVGVMLSRIFNFFMRCDLRVNYEQYFYPNGAMVAPGEDSKIVTELVIRF